MVNMRSSSILTVAIPITAWVCSLLTMAMAHQSINITHYTHEVRGGPHSSILLAAGTPQPDLAVGAAWGSFIVFDNELRHGPEPNSTLLGRITGTATGIGNPANVPDNQTRVQLVVHHVYTSSESEYVNSHINLLGIFYSVTEPPEFAVPGCTGKLRGYSGYGICTQLLQTTGPPPLYLTYRWDLYLTKP